MLMDLHCHLDLYADPHGIASEVIQREIYLLSVTTTPSAWSVTSTLGKNSPFIRTALGLHPQLAAERRHELSLFGQYLTETKYVGEIGLDGSDDYQNTYEIQKNVFETILKLCESHGGKILSIHSRCAARDVILALKRYPCAGVPIFHWFSGTQDELHEAININGWFSIGMSMLQTKKGIRLVSQIPRNRILLETDGPFSSINGRPQLPWDVEGLIPALAGIWKLSLVETKSLLRHNLFSLTTLVK